METLVRPAAAVSEDGLIRAPIRIAIGDVMEPVANAPRSQFTSDDVHQAGGGSSLKAKAVASALRIPTASI